MRMRLNEDAHGGPCHTCKDSAETRLVQAPEVWVLSPFF